MEYLVFCVAVLAVILFVFVQGKLNEKQQLEYFKRRLREQKGKAPDKEYKIERFIRIPGYFEKHQEGFQIDDITWNDLGMDDVFRRINYCVSSTGDEVLYHMLRTPSLEKDRLERFEKMVSFFSEHEEELIKYQCAMRKLGSTGKYSLYDYLYYLERLDRHDSKKEILSNLLLVGLIIFAYFNLAMGVATILVWTLFQLQQYFKVKNSYEPYLTSLAYIMRMVEVGQEVCKELPEVCENEREVICEAAKSLKKAKKGSNWVFGSLYKTGSPADVMFDYVRMFFHVDLIYFNHMLDEIMLHKDQVDKMITAMGTVEAAGSVALYRESLDKGWCKPEFREGELLIENGYHPLLTNPVKNTIQTGKNVLLTGSNASGKSTFLKTTALASLLSQTINTVTADKYEAPFYQLYSSMSLKDDLDSGDSYYIVEIKSIKRILDSMEKYDGKILCFVDEVLRGTNTVERIAASTQILLSMSGDKIQCFAATHDIELTGLLKNYYENYHFEEEVRDGDVLFNYCLQPGKATTRNAIKLLEIMGYEPEIIEKARNQADVFLKQGVWQLS